MEATRAGGTLVSAITIFRNTWLLILCSIFELLPGARAADLSTGVGYEEHDGPIIAYGGTELPSFCELARTALGAHVAGERLGALLNLEWSPKGPALFGVLVAALGDEDTTVSGVAAEVLATLYPNESAPILTHLLQHAQSVSERVGVLEALAVTGVGNDATRSVLLDAAASKVKAVALAADYALARTEKANVPTYALALGAAVNDASLPPVWRLKALNYLMEMGQRARPAVPALIAAMEDKQIRIMAIITLGYCDVTPGRAVPALLHVLDDYPLPQGAGAAALQSLGHYAARSEAARAPFLAILKSPNSRYDLMALMYLKQGKVDVPEVRDALAPLALRDSEVRGVLYSYLAGLSGPPSTYLERAKQDIRGSDEEAAEGAVEYVSALARDPKTSADAIPVLLDGVRSVHAQVRWRTALLLGQPSQCPVAARVRELTALLKDADYGVVRQAVRSLTLLGPSAHAARGALEEQMASYPGSAYRKTDISVGLTPLSVLVERALDSLGPERAKPASSE